MNLETILVAIDFSEQSSLALDHAIAVARRVNGELVLLWVEGELTRAPSGAAIYGKAVREVEKLAQDLRAESAARLDALAERARRQGVAASARVEPGDPAEVIVELASQVHADLVVMGTKGVTGFKRFFLGSVATKVVRTCSTHVLVARDARAELARILVPADFSPASEKALELVLALAAAHAEITLFHAWQYPPGAWGVLTPEPEEGPLRDLRDEIVARNDERARTWIEKHATQGVSIRFVQEYGAAAAAIQEHLDRAPYDLVAMGTHGYHGLQRFLLGSVAEATVRHSPCSVLVAHAGEGQEAR